MATTFSFVCPNCKNKMRASTEYVGQRGRCPACKALVEIRAAGSEGAAASVALTAPQGPAAATADFPGWLPGVIGAVATLLLYLLVFMPLTAWEAKSRADRKQQEDRAKLTATQTNGEATAQVPVRAPLDLGHKFTDRGSVMWFETFFFCWGAALLALKYFSVKRQLSYAELELQLIPIEIGLQITPANVDQFLNNLNQQPPAIRFSILGRRINGALEHFKSRNNVSEVQAYLATQGEIDASAVDSGYSLVKAFIWAIPILGFIGTVIGLSAAVGGLHTLGGDSDLASGLKVAMEGVTKGLATAFDTTLVALIMAVVLLFPMEALRRTEYRMLDRIEQFSNDSLLRRMGTEQEAMSVEEMPAVVRDALQAAFGQHQRWLVQWQAQVAQLGQVIGADFEAAVGRIQEKLLGGDESRFRRLAELSQVIEGLFEKSCESTELWQKDRVQSAGDIKLFVEATGRLEQALAAAADRAATMSIDAPAGLVQQVAKLEEQIARLADVLCTSAPTRMDGVAQQGLAAPDGNGDAGVAVSDRRRGIFKFW